jgi:hypothetical protein
MANDARENYKAVFGVYPNDSHSRGGDTPQIQTAQRCALLLETTANELQASWQNIQFVNVSDQAQKLLKEIQAAATLLRSEISAMNASESSLGPVR